MPRGEPTRSVPVRLTAAERERLEAAAKAAREPLTVFLRRVALEAAAAPVRVTRTVAVDGREIHRAAVAALPTVAEATRAGRRAARAGVPAAEESARLAHALRRERPAHHPTCKCGVCRPPKPAKS
jgi:uncharacterized protein (DUF1778 family)